MKMSFERKEPAENFYEPSPQPGDMADRWALPDGTGQSHQLSDILSANDFVVLTVYRGHW